MTSRAGPSTTSPPWCKDELILALDLYISRGGSERLNARSDEVIRISNLIRSLPVFDAEVRAQSRFRTPASVALKLHNIASVDPSYGRSGMSHGAAGDHWVWRRWSDQPDQLRETADAIERLATDRRSDIASPVAGEDADPRGRLVHRRLSSLAALRVRQLQDQQVDQVRCHNCGGHAPLSSAIARFNGPIRLLTEAAALEALDLFCNRCGALDDPPSIEILRPVPLSVTRPSFEATARVVLETAEQLGEPFDFPTMMSRVRADRWGTLTLSSVRSVLERLASDESTALDVVRPGVYVHRAVNPQSHSAMPSTVPPSTAPSTTAQVTRSAQRGVRDLIVAAALRSDAPFDVPTLRRWATDEGWTVNDVDTLRACLMQMADAPGGEVRRIRRGFYAHVSKAADRGPMRGASALEMLSAFARHQKEPFTWRGLKRWAVGQDVGHDIAALKAEFQTRIGSTNGQQDVPDPRFRQSGKLTFEVVVGPQTRQPLKSRRGGRTDPDRIKAMRLAGQTLQQIATDQGVTRERIRQILLTLGVSAVNVKRDIKHSRDTAEAARRDVMTRAAVVALRETSCTSIEDLSMVLGESPDLLRAVLPREVKRLLVEVSDAESTERLTDDEALAAIAEAGTFEYPLSTAMYKELLRAGSVDGLSVARVTQRFGSWRQACERAGVEAVPAMRSEYQSKWSDDDLAAAVADFLELTTESTSVGAYDTWAQSHTGYPGAQTLRNRIGGWSAARHVGLNVLRGRTSFWMALLDRAAPRTELSDDASSIVYAVSTSVDAAPRESSAT